MYFVQNNGKIHQTLQARTNRRVRVFLSMIRCDRKREETGEEAGPEKNRENKNKSNYCLDMNKSNNIG